MSSSFRTLLVYLGALGIIGAGAFVMSELQKNLPGTPDRVPSEITQVATVATTNENTAPARTRAPAEEKQSISPVETKVQSETSPPHPSAPEEALAGLVRRIADPYAFPPESFLSINQKTSAALVNILCTTDGRTVQSISGSGVIIDPRGVVLTNAHIAQYVLLAESERTNILCTVRAGSPARTIGNPTMLYISPAWVGEHAADITNPRPTGTGEHDYALFHITPSSDPQTPPLPSTFPSLPIDTRAAIAFRDDTVLSASYPAEFIGGGATRFDLHPLSSIGPIKELLTFDAGTVDLLSLGGVAGAQSGSSGGPVVNAWSHVVGVITTTSEGATTAERELHALTMNYINRDLLAQTGSTIAELLTGDVAARAATFSELMAPALVEVLIEQVASESNR